MESRPQQQDNTNFMLLRNYYQGQFLKYFEQIPGDKTVYFDEKIIK